MREWNYIDVHAHMSHERFSLDIDEVIKECRENKVAVICNGTDASSNLASLDLASKYKGTVYPAMGIYPVEALYNMGESISQAGYTPQKFDLEAQIEFIDQSASSHKLIAIGEIGMDAHSLGEDSYKKQEELFVRLASIGIKNDLCLIVHSRKMESKTLKVLEDLKAPRVIMHCYCGNVSEALSYSQRYGWMFSLPVTTPTHSKLSVLCKRLDPKNILLETDSPYLNIDRGIRNSPVNIIKTFDYISKVKQISPTTLQEILMENFNRVFSYVEE